MSEQTLALAGVFQAAELVRQAANHGTWSGYAATTCLDSLLRLESDSTLAVYGGKDRLNLGLKTLLAVLSGEEQPSATLQHVVALMQVERKFTRNAAMQNEVGTGLAGIAGEGAELEQHERQDRQAGAIAELYSRTISRLSPRIIVTGKPQYLQSPRTVNWIRTLLFSGLRSVVLWHQLGGGRFKLMFGRRQLLEEAHELLTG